MAEPDDWGGVPIESAHDDWGGIPIAAAANPSLAEIPVDETTPSDDHGLSERRKLSLIEKAISPITSYPSTYSKMKNEAVETLGHGVHQLASPESAWDFAKGVGNTALGAVEYVGSPINAAYRSVAGQPIEDVTGIPREYTEFAAQLATPGLGLRALSPKTPGAIPKPSELQPSVAGRAAVPESDSANELGIPLSRGQATRDLDAIRYEDMASRGAYGPKAQEEAVKFFDDQFKAIQTAGANVGETLGRTGPNVGDAGEAATVINSELLSTAEKARAVVAEAERRAAAEVAAHEAASVNAGRTLDETVRAGRAPVQNVREAGETVGQGVRDAAETARQDYKGKYNEAFDLPGEFGVGTFTDIGRSIKNKLTNGESPVIVDDTTPISSRALDDLNKIQNLKFENKAHAPGTDVVSASDGPSEIVAVNLKGVDQARKLLVQRYQQAKAKGRATQDFSDQRGMERIIDAFDDHIEQSISNGLFSGDPRALAALQEARASFSNYRKTYRPNAGDDISTALNRIVSRNATPEEIGNMIVGSGKIGNAGLPVRLAEKLKTIFGEDSDQWSAIRQGIWQRASAVRNAAGEFDAARSASTLNDFTNTTLARTVFTPAELKAMRSHADGIRELDRLVETLPSSQIAKQAKGIYQQAFGGADIGGSQATVFRRIMDGTATPQETTQAILGAVNSSSSGNVVRALKAIEKIVGPESDTMNAIRRGVWEKLTKNAIGKDQPGQQKIVQAINEFLNGQGRMVAQQLYSPKELDLMKKFAEAVKLTVIPKYARTNSDTAPAILAAAHKYAGSIAAAIGELFGHGVFSAVTGYGVGKMLQSGIDKIKDMKELNRVRGQFEPPSAVKAAPKRGMAVALPPNAPLMLTSPPRYPFLQSPSTAGAGEDQRKIPRPPGQQHNGGQVDQVHSRGYADGGTPLADDAIDPAADQPPPVSSPQLEADEAQLAREAAAARVAHAAHPGQRQEGLLTRVPEMLADDIYRSGKKIVTGPVATLEALQRRYNPQEGDVLSDYDVSPEDIAAGTTAEAAGAIFPGYSGKLLQLPTRGAVRDVAPRVAQFAANAADKETAKGAVRNELARDVSDAGFYSHGTEAAQSLPQETGTPQQMRAMLEKAGVKKEEFDNANWDLVFGNQPKVTKQEVSTLFKDSMVPIHDVMKGGPSNDFDAVAKRSRQNPSAFKQELEDAGLSAIDAENRITRINAGDHYTIARTADYLRSNEDNVAPKFASYQLPGGENYRELLLTLPTKNQTYNGFSKELKTKYGDVPFGRMPLTDTERTKLDNLMESSINETDEGVGRFKSSHWEEPNVLAHIRFNDRTIDGKKTLFVEEVQSDWHQKGRRHGYAAPPSDELAEMRALDAIPHDQLTEMQRARGRELMERVSAEERAARNTVPDAPFKSTWPDLAMKRVMKYAADNGYDQVAWTPGKVQSDRYDLSKQIKKISYVGDDHLTAWDHNGEKVITKSGVKPDELQDLIGKEAAQKLLDQKPKEIERLKPVKRNDLSVTQTDHQYIVKNKDGRQVEIGKGTVGNEAEALDYAVRYLSKRAEEINRDREFALGRIGPTRTLEGLDLRVGGEGMTGFYDKILPAKVNALVKKHGAKVETKNIAGEGRSRAEINRDMDANSAELDRREPKVNWSDFKEGDAAWQRHPDLRTKHHELQSEYNAMMSREEAPFQSAHVVPITPSLRDELRGGVRMFSNAVDKNSVARNEAVRAATQTPEFKKWFGDSKVVDAEGHPQIVFHGTKSPDIATFERDKAGASDPGLIGKAFYFTPSPEQASDFAINRHYGRGESPNVIPAYVSLKNPAEIIDGRLPDGRTLTNVHPQGITKQSGASIQRELRKAGHDGAIFKTGGEIVQVVAFEPTQIKSAIGNRGSFDPSDKRIQRASGGPVNEVECEDANSHPERQSSSQWEVELRATGGAVAKRQNATPEQKKTFEAAQQRGSGENRSTGGSVPARAHGGRVEASNINHEPTEAQKHAGNYAKDHVNIFGLSLTIENAKGSIRRGVGPDGKAWACVLPAHYGYVKKSHSQDDDNLDVYLGPHSKSPHVFLIDQHDLRTGKFDEHKAVFGMGSQKQALACYERAFSDGKGRARIGGVTTMTIPQFKEWLATESEKRTHSSVDYVEMATDKDHCAICAHFIKGNPPACTGVKSPISPTGWCNRFKRN